MCTAISYKAKDFYFGRTLDYECSYGEEVVITPRHYQFSYSHMGECTTHYAMIGMAHVAEEYPLYYEAVNEKGLGMAGLNFVGPVMENMRKMPKMWRHMSLFRGYWGLVRVWNR